MKQVLQSLRDGTTEVADVPRPALEAGQLLIRTTHTLVSAGTERMLVDFGRAGLLDKARQHPDKVRQVLDKVRTDGVLPTIERILGKLDQPVQMGYCNVGVVLEVGAGVTGFRADDRVASNGRHAEVVAVPANLCAKVPDNVDDESAAFTVMGAIALQGIRLVQPTLGEAVVVTGLGLVGLLTVQLLRAQGCRVIGLDFDADKVALARRFGAEAIHLTGGADPVASAMVFSRGRGVDAVLITASTTSNEPVHQAALMCRKRGRIVLVGVAGLELSRADFYEKELSFQVSCSYGPGRYDPSYEDKGHDYPFGYVRWTEQRNFEAVLDMLSDRRLDAQALVTHRFEIGSAQEAYRVVAGSEPSLGIVIRYPTTQGTVTPPATVARTVALPGEAAPAHPASLSRMPSVSFIGAGNYAGAVLIPAFKATGARLHRIASSGGVSSVHFGRKFGFAEATTDTQALFRDAETDIAVIGTRHDSHARFVLQALAAGKHVFVEKPLALSLEDVASIEQASLAAPRSRLMVGFNRRFAPHVVKVKQLLATRPGPRAFVMLVNAGAIDPEHWTHDAKAGGGRLVGEACHHVDLLRFLADAPITDADVQTMAGITGDSMSLSLTFADGSIGTVHYLANGGRAFPKERLEVFAGGAVLQLDNFRRLTGYGWPGFTSMSTWRQDKGQTACVSAFVRSVRDDTPAPIPLAELLEVARVTIGLSARQQQCRA